jgi:putative acetyltransferase
MPPPGYLLRALAPDDYEEALSLWRATEGMGIGESDTRPAIEAFLLRNPGLSRCITGPDGRLAGTVLCGHDGRRGCLHHLAVARSHRGLGLGRALVDGCTADLRALGLEKCNLFLFSDNAAGRDFWLHEGWTPREDLVVIQKTL